VREDLTGGGPPRRRRTVALAAVVAVVAVTALVVAVRRDGGPASTTGDAPRTVVAGGGSQSSGGVPAAPDQVQGRLPDDHPVVVAVRQVVDGFEEESGRRYLRGAAVGPVDGAGTGADRAYRATLSTRTLEVSVVLARRDEQDPPLCRAGDDGCVVEPVQTEPPTLWYAVPGAARNGLRSRTVEVALANRTADGLRWAVTLTAGERRRGGTFPGRAALQELAYFLVTAVPPRQDQVDLPPEALPVPTATPDELVAGGPLDPRNRLPAELTDADVDRAMRQVAAQVRATATSPAVRDLEYLYLTREEPADRPKLSALFATGDTVQVVVDVAPWRATDASLCTPPENAPCREETEAGSPPSRWFLPEPLLEGFPRTVLLEVRLVYPADREEPWSATLVARETGDAPTGAPFPSVPDLRALALAAAAALAPPEVTLQRGAGSVP
jgi:hypothetical protein